MEVDAEVRAGASPKQKEKKKKKKKKIPEFIFTKM